MGRRKNSTQRVHRRRRIRVGYWSEVGREICRVANDARSLSIKTGSGINPCKLTRVTSYLRSYPRLER